MEPLESLQHVFVPDDPSVERTAEGWVFKWAIIEPTELVPVRVVLSDDELLRRGPPARMTTAELEDLARRLGREPLDVSWVLERRLVECLPSDDVATFARLCPAGVPPSLAEYPALTRALSTASFRIAQLLLDRGAPLLPPPKSVWAGPDYAIAAFDDSDGAVSVLESLIARGLLGPLDGLLRHARAPRIARMLLAAGADPNSPGPATGWNTDPVLADATPLAVAVVRGRFEVAAALLEAGASLELRDARGRTALLVAVYWGNAAPVRWLLEHGAAIEQAPDSKGRTPLGLARARPQDPAAQVLLAAAAAR